MSTVNQRSYLIGKLKKEKVIDNKKREIKRNLRKRIPNDARN